MTETAPAEQLIQSLRHVSQQFESGSPEELLQQGSQVLSALAVCLRDQTEREPAGALGLCGLLVTVLSHALGPRDHSDRHPAELGLLGQAARVAANLVADCDTNRDRLVAAGYASEACRALELASHKDARVTQLIVASLLNLVVDGHGEAIRSLASQTCVDSLLGAAVVMRPMRFGGNVDSDDQQPAFSWLLNILSLVIADEQAASLQITHEQLEPISSVLREIQVDADDIPLIGHAGKVFETLAAGDGGAYTAVIPALPAIIRFLSEAAMSWTRDGSEDLTQEEEDENEAQLSRTKASLAHAIIDMGSHLDPGDPTQKIILKALEEWMLPEARDDLISTALLCFGNVARQDATAIALMAEDRILRRAILTFANSEQPVLVQHAVLGLLRNLAIPASNKELMLELGIVEQLSKMRPWQEKMDIAKAVQANGVGVVKNLCRGCVQCTSFFLSRPACEELQLLLKRTDDASLRFEVTRIFVNAARSLGGDSGQDHSALWCILARETILQAFVDMLVQGKDYPALINEAVIALALCAVYGPTRSKASIVHQLQTVSVGAASSANPLQMLLEFLDVEGAQVVSKEVRANVATLLEQLVTHAGADEARVRQTLSTHAQLYTLEKS